LRNRIVPSGKAMKRKPVTPNATARPTNSRRSARSSEAGIRPGIDHPAGRGSTRASSTVSNARRDGDAHGETGAARGLEADRAAEGACPLADRDQAGAAVRAFLLRLDAVVEHL